MTLRFVMTAYSFVTLNMGKRLAFHSGADVIPFTFVVIPVCRANTIIRKFSKFRVKN